MSFHAASLDSPRLKKLLALLQERGESGATTMEICDQCASTRASSDISELRKNGVQVAMEYRGLNGNNRKVYRYKLT